MIMSDGREKGEREGKFLDTATKLRKIQRLSENVISMFQTWQGGVQAYVQQQLLYLNIECLNARYTEKLERAAHLVRFSTNRSFEM